MEWSDDDYCCRLWLVWLDNVISTLTQDMGLDVERVSLECATPGGGYRPVVTVVLDTSSEDVCDCILCSVLRELQADVR